MVKDLVTGEVWTPKTDFIRAMYNLGRYVDNTQGELHEDTTGGQGPREAEFNRWLEGERRANVLGCIAELMWLKEQGSNSTIDFDAGFNYALDKAIELIKSEMGLK